MAWPVAMGWFKPRYLLWPLAFSMLLGACGPPDPVGLFIDAAERGREESRCWARLELEGPTSVTAAVGWGTDQWKRELLVELPWSLCIPKQSSGPPIGLSAYDWFGEAPLRCSLSIDGQVVARNSGRLVACLWEV